MTIKNKFAHFGSLVLIFLVLTGCATQGGSNSFRAASSDAADKTMRSSQCRGKIQENRSALRKLQELASDPVSFTCNLTYRLSKAMVLGYEAAGREELAARARVSRDGLLNGTLGVSSLAHSNICDDACIAKVADQDISAIENDEARKEKIRFAAAEMNQARQETGLAIASIFIQYKTQQMLMNDARRSKSDLQSSLAAFQTIKFIADVAVIATHIPGIADSVQKYNANMRDLNNIARVEEANFKDVQVKPD